MKALIQRVKSGKVSVAGKTIGEIGKGYVILLGVKDGDSEKEVFQLSQKVVTLRIMSDEAGKMNKSILDVGGEILIISQFTLYADTSGGRRPSFIAAAKPEVAHTLYVQFIDELKRLGVRNVQTGSFGAYMNVSIENDGPVTILVESN
ncbi:D-tyrosyl-tRNA(Tyr) deacylase [Candidatus Gottesmanbacteria bacterium]|nr:D-tyrosyl-tRNA(Tyr) deacylase [Candidatus Gottesmanbacteria bacterium]